MLSILSGGAHPSLYRHLWSEKATHGRFLQCGWVSWVTTIWAGQSDVDGCIMPSSNICWTSCLINLRSGLLYLWDLAAVGLKPGRRFSNSLTEDMDAAIRLQEDLSEALLLENLCLLLYQRFPILRADNGPLYSIITVSCFYWKSWPNMRSGHRFSITPTITDWCLLPYNSISILHMPLNCTDLSVDARSTSWLHNWNLILSLLVTLPFM